MEVSRTMLFSKDKQVSSQSNQLIEAHYKLSPIEHKLIFSLASLVRKEDTDFKDYEIRVKDFADFVGIDQKNIYAQIDDTLKRLSNKSVVIYTGRERVQYFGWFSYAEYLPTQGIIKIRFDKYLKPHFINFQNEFTKLNIEVFNKFRSFYTMRIYMLISQYQNSKTQERIIDLLKLKKMLGIEKKQYTQYKEFNKFVLKKAKSELSEKDEQGNFKSNMNFDYETIKTGRKVTAIRFILKKQNIVRIISQEKKSIESISYLLAYGVSQRKSEELAERHAEGEILKCISLYEDKKKRGKADTVGLLIKLIEEGAGKKTEEEIKQEGKQKKLKEQKSQEQIEKLKEGFVRDYEKMAKKEFINSLSPNEQELLLTEILKNYENNGVVFDIVKKAGLECQLIGAKILARITDYEKNKEKHISEQLKKVV